MKTSAVRPLAVLSIACAMAVPITLFAQDQSMMPPKPGPEIKAIAPIFGSGTAHWSGKVEAGAMGPDSKEMTSNGTVTTHAIVGGFWYAADVTDTWGTGKQAFTWKGHMLVGYDVSAKAYKGSCVDNTGILSPFDGTLEGDKFMLETPQAVMIAGQMMKDRLTWDMTDPHAIKFTDEHQSEGSDWKVVESATMKTSAAHSTAKKKA